MSSGQTASRKVPSRINAAAQQLTHQAGGFLPRARAGVRQPLTIAGPHERRLASSTIDATGPPESGHWPPTPYAALLSQRPLVRVMARGWLTVLRIAQVRGGTMVASSLRRPDGGARSDRCRFSCCYDGCTPTPTTIRTTSLDSRISLAPASSHLHRTMRSCRSGTRRQRRWAFR